MEKIILPTNDYAFKRIFGKLGNEKITQNLLNSILDENIENVELDCNTILEKDIYDDKIGILDIKAKLNNKFLCNIEMQIANQKNIEKRLLYYWSKLYTSGIKEGEDYSKLKKTIVILIADFELEILKETAKYHTKWKIYESNHRKIILTDILELNIIELPKTVYEIKEDYNKELLNWLKFIKNPEMIGEEEMEKNPELRKAKEEYGKFNQDEHEKYIAELRDRYVREKKTSYVEGVEERIKQGIEQGRAEGIKKGEKETLIKTAKKLLKVGMSIEEISEITELTKEEIKKL